MSDAFKHHIPQYMIGSIIVSSSKFTVYDYPFCFWKKKIVFWLILYFEMATFLFCILYIEFGVLIIIQSVVVCKFRVKPHDLN